MYTNFEKEKLGKTFQYYRHKYSYKWDYIIKKSTISKNTIYKMMNGHIFSEDKYYDEMLKIFDLKFHRNIQFEKWINNYLSELCKEIEYYNIEQLETSFNTFFIMMEKYKTIPIYEQYYICINHIFNYYLNNKCVDEEDLELAFIMIESNLFENELAIYLLETLHISNYNNIGSETYRKKIIHLLENYDHPIKTHIMGIDYKCETKLNDALKIFTELDEYWGNKNNYYRQVKALNGLFMIYKNIDYGKANETIIKLKEAQKGNNIPDSLKKSINYNIGMYYYSSHLYKEAMEIFEINVKEYEGINELIFIATICTRLDIELPQYFLDVDYSTSPYKLYIEYFKMKKSKKSYDELVYFIMTVLLNDKLAHVRYEEPLWKIYEYELYEIIKKSKKHLQSYIKFIEFKEKILNNA